VSLTAEALVAVTGIFHAEPLGPADGLAAHRLPAEWRDQVKTFFHQERPRKFRLYPRPAHEATLDRLLAAPDLAMLTGQLADPELVTEYGVVLNNAREFMRQRWPSLTMDGFAGPRLLEPGWTMMAAVWAVLAVVDKPSRLLTEVLSATVMAEQVAACKVVYPELSKVLLGILQERKQTELARKKTWSVPWPKERVLRILLELPADVAIKEAPQSPARAASGKINVDFSTRTQRLEGK
jgi:hypothetical protein